MIPLVLYDIFMLVGFFYWLAAVLYLRRARAKLHEMSDILENLKKHSRNVFQRGLKELGEETSSPGVWKHQEFVWTPAPHGDALCLLGHDMQIKHTAIGKPFRLIHKGQEVGQFDDVPTATLKGIMMLDDTPESEDLSAAPKVVYPWEKDDEPG